MKTQQQSNQITSFLLTQLTNLLQQLDLIDLANPYIQEQSIEHA